MFTLGLLFGSPIKCFQYAFVVAVCFRVRSPHVTDGRTDGWTNGRDRHVMWIIRTERPRNNVKLQLSRC